MDFEKLALLCLIGFFAAITPGPDVLLTLRATLKFGALQGLRVLCGIACGWICYMALIYAGLSHYLNAPPIQAILSLIGGIYLLYLGFCLLTQPKIYDFSTTNEAKSAKKEGFWQGLVLNLSNPKAMLFFIFLVTPFMDNAMFFSLFCLWLSLCFAFIVLIILASVARGFINARTFGIIDRICAVLFIAFSYLLLYECGALALEAL